ncbi:MAG TPA: hypothetical protein VI998_01845 [Patescibacteria group bacterium]|nr:hypothetical protein [Patescibacteria group bacterium]
MPFKHKNLARGAWHEFSLIEQMANVGSEISRAVLWQNKDEQVFKNAVDRALELLDLTIQDSRWRKRLKEIVRVREMLIDALGGGKEYGSSFESLDKYFLSFTLAARLHR